MNPAITIQNLTKIYDQPQRWQRWLKRHPVTAVSDINLTIPQGELFGLLGPNGAGKTTLVKMLCTLISPTSGDGQIAGYSLQESGKIRGAVGLVVSDERSFFWRLSARRNLTFFAAMYGLTGREAEKRVDAVLEYVDLHDVAERRFSHYSSGMKQRLAIARSLLHQPRILFMDEPTRSLDPTATQHLHDLISQLMSEQALTVFLITHDLPEAEKLCDRVALMHNGRIRTIGQPSELRAAMQPYRDYTIQVGQLATAVWTMIQQLYPDMRRESTPQGMQITFRAQEEDPLLTAVIDILRQHNLTIQSISGTLPSLEEVFTHYTNDTP